MKKFRPSELTKGFRPYIALAVLMLAFYLALSPFIKLPQTGFSGFGGDGAQNGTYGAQNGTSSGVRPRGGFLGGTRGTSSGTDARRETYGAPSGTSSGTGTQPHGEFGAGTRDTYGTSSGETARPSGEFGRGGSGARNGASSGARGGFGADAPSEGDLTARVLMAAGVLAALGFAAALYYRRRLTPRLAGAFVVAAGVVMRFGYMLYTPYSVRGHDVGTLDGNGHLAYLYTVYQNFRLPSSGGGQFYHPPLNYLAEAAVAHLYAFVTRSTDVTAVLESARLVPCFASCALLIVAWRIFTELDFNYAAKLLAIGLLAFQPTFFILSASINNDMLMVFFLVAAFLYTVRWYRRPTFKNIILLAVLSGCAMMTKLSGGLIAALSAGVFLAVFVRGVRSHAFGRLIGQFAAYAGIFLPLGLWYPIRNLVLFNQPIGYVLQVGQNTGMYTGGKSVLDRFFSFPVKELFNPVYCNPYGDFRLWIYTVKCSLFGEFTFPDDHRAVAAVLIVLNLLLIALTAAAIVYVLCHHRESLGIARWGFLGLIVLVLASFIAFNIKYPEGCTMDFRYIVPVLVGGAGFLGLFGGQLRARGGGPPRLFYCLTVFAVAAFGVFSTIFFVM